MQSEDNFIKDYIDRMAGIPHLGANITQHLHIKDVSNMIKTSKAFRTLFWTGFYQDMCLRERVNADATTLACANGTWSKSEFGIIQEEEGSHFFGEENYECFAFQSSLWTIKEINEKTQVKAYQLPRNFQEVPGNISSRQTFNCTNKVNAQITLGLGPRMVLNCGDKVVVFGDKISSWSVKEASLADEYLGDMSAFDFVEEPCKLFERVRNYIPYWQLVFYAAEKDGHLVSKNHIEMKYPPFKLLRKGNYVLAILESHDYSGCMWNLDNSSGLVNPSWQFFYNEEGIDHEFHGINLFLTDSFCGFVRRVRVEQWSDQHADGCFELTLRDNKTGKMIIKPLNFFHSCFDLQFYETKAMPHVVTLGNTVCIIGSHFRHDFNALCVRLDENKECKLKGADLKMLLLAKCIEEEESIYYTALLDRKPHIEIESGGVRILGTVGERVIVGQLKFDYYGLTGSYSATVLFTIDTNAFIGDDKTKILKFPLLGKNKGILDERNVDYWPHFMTNAKGKKEGSKLMGVVEVDNDPQCRGKVTGYYFKRRLDNLKLVEFD